MHTQAKRGLAVSTTAGTPQCRAAAYCWGSWARGESRERVFGRPWRFGVGVRCTGSGLPPGSALLNIISVVDPRFRTPKTKSSTTIGNCTLNWHLSVSGGVRPVSGGGRLVDPAVRTPISAPSWCSVGVQMLYFFKCLYIFKYDLCLCLYLICVLYVYICFYVYVYIYYVVYL